jgi:hypothetical protein
LCEKNVTEVLSDRECFLFSLLEGNRTTHLPEYVNISGLGHTLDFQLQHVFPQPLLYIIPEIQLLTTPTHTFPLLSSANTSPPLHPTAHNHGYYAVADYSSVAILSPGLCARSPENDEKGEKDKKNHGSIHTLQSLPHQEGAVCTVWFRVVQKYEFV